MLVGCHHWVFRYPNLQLLQMMSVESLITFLVWQVAVLYSNKHLRLVRNLSRPHREKLHFVAQVRESSALEDLLNPIYG